MMPFTIVIHNSIHKNGLFDVCHSQLSFEVFHTTFGLQIFNMPFIKSRDLLSTLSLHSHLENDSINDQVSLNLISGAVPFHKQSYFKNSGAKTDEIAKVCINLVIFF